MSLLEERVPPRCDALSVQSQKGCDAVVCESNSCTTIHGLALEAISILIQHLTPERWSAVEGLVEGACSREVSVLDGLLVTRLSKAAFVRLAAPARAACVAAAVEPKGHSGATPGGLEGKQSLVLRCIQQSGLTLPSEFGLWQNRAMCSPTRRRRATRRLTSSPSCWTLNWQKAEHAPF